MSERVGTSDITAEGSCSHTLGRAQGLRAGSCARQSVTVVRALARRGASVLMLRRAAGDSLGGCWELPGGKLDELGDGLESPLQALAREFEEECGLKWRGTPHLIASTSRVSPKGKLVVELMYVADAADGEARLSDEHDEARWYPLHERARGQLTESAADGLAVLRAGAAA